MDERVKSLAKDFLRMPIDIDKKFSGICHHPFANVPVSFDGKNMIDLTKESDFKRWITIVEKYIDNADTIIRLLLLFNKPYVLTFIKYAEPFLTIKELSEALGNWWTIVEYISNDTNVSGEELVRMFKKCDKKVLMEPDDYKIWKSLPSKVSVFRGVTDYNKDKKFALSWTLNRDKAKWFANRFNQKGVVWEKEIPKDRILWYTDSRNEQEVVVDLY